MTRIRSHDIDAHRRSSGRRARRQFAEVVERETRASADAAGSARGRPIADSSRRSAALPFEARRPKLVDDAELASLAAPRA
jgi:hypothetical protein